MSEEGHSRIGKLNQELKQKRTFATGEINFEYHLFQNKEHKVIKRNYYTDKNRLISSNKK